MLYSFPTNSLPNGHTATEEQGQQLTLPTEVGHLPVDVLMLDQTPDLTVNHPVKLGNQDDVIAQLSMLRKEGQPLGPAGLLPFSCIKQQLALIDHQKDRSFLRLLGSKALPAVIDQEFRLHLIIGTVSVAGSFVLAEIHREVADHRISQARPICNCPGTMQALAGTRCSAVQADHISHQSLSASA